MFPTLDDTDRDPPESLAVVDLLCEECIGFFLQPLYSKENKRKRKRILASLKHAWDGLTQKICRCCWKPRYKMAHVHQHLPLFQFDREKDEKYSQQYKLRDLFLWSVLMGHVKLTEVLLVHLKPRICASLIASKVFMQYSKTTNIIHFQEKMKNIAEQFELYAVKCINSCYEYNETKACEIVLRQIPLFGNITCAQV